MSKTIGYRRKRNGSLEIDIYDINDWEGFESLIKFVKKYYSANLIAKYDGPDARRWILEIKGKEFEIIFNDGFGNYFVAPEKNSESIVIKICEDIGRRLGN